MPNLKIESAKSIADLKTSYSVTRAKLQTHVEVPGDEKRVVSRRSSTETSKEESSFKKKLHKKKSFLTGRQVACMICESFKVSDTDDSVSDLNEILKDEPMNRSIRDGMKP